MSKKIALITGITGMDGSNLARLLLNKGFEVYGIIRRSSTPNTVRIDDVFDPEDATHIFYGDITEGFAKYIYSIKPNYIFNTCAMSHVRISFDIPIYTAEVVGVGVMRLLEDIKNGIKWGIISKDIKFLQCSSSEMYGITPPPQNELSPMQPVSPYGISKLMAYLATKSYRVGYGMFASNSICFNHEGIYRGVNFVTKKISRAIAKIKLSAQKELYLGNLDAKRDWGDSRDYVEAMLMILEYDKSDDFVIATGFQYSIRDFINEACLTLNFDLWKYIKIEERLKRPLEVPSLLGDATKIRKTLGWYPKISFKQLVREMVEYDYQNELKNLNEKKNPY